MSESDKAKKKKTHAELVKAKEEKLKQVKAELARLKRAESQQERKKRDTGIFTIGACILAAADSEDENLRNEVRRIWKLAFAAHGLNYDDYRVSCVRDLNVLDVSQHRLNRSIDEDINSKFEEEIFNSVLSGGTEE